MGLRAALAHSLDAFPDLGPKRAAFGWYPFHGKDVPEWLTAGGWLAGARHIHFAVAWFLVLNGVIYLVYLIASGEWRRRVFNLRRDLLNSLQTALYYLTIRKEPERALTSAADFPVDHLAEEVPVAPPGWRLQVAGLCAWPLSLSVADLKRLPRTELRVRHHCVEGWSAVASWHGARMSDIASACGSDARARYVEFRSFDAAEPDDDSADGKATLYYSCWDREGVEHPQTLLAYGMNDQDLHPGNGAPVRLYSAVKLGFKMVKHLTEIIDQPMRTGGYWGG